MVLELVEGILRIGAVALELRTRQDLVRQRGRI
jgi:hypothetical protein